MTEFLQSIKSDLLSRRLLPLLALLAVALIAAVAYALTGGSGGSSPSPSASAPSTPGAGGPAALPVAVAPVNPHLAISETPGGLRYQSHSPTRDPFVPLPSPLPAKSASASASKSSSSPSASSKSKGSSSSGSGSSSGGSSAGGHATPTPVLAKPPKPRPAGPIYVVSALASGPVSPGQTVTVTPYETLKPNEPIPSKADMRLTFERVIADGKGAVFKLVVAPILRGSARCLPSPSECEAIDLAPGQVEELEYVEANGQTVTYGLKVVSITKVVLSSKAARVKGAAKVALVRGAGTTPAVGRASVVLSRARPQRAAQATSR
jgi:hypothetical protein